MHLSVPARPWALCRDLTFSHPNEMMSRKSTPSSRSLEFTQITEWDDGAFHTMQDSLAAEEPLQILVNGVPLNVTMRTPGDDLDLAAGFLFTEGIIDSPDQIVALSGPPERQKKNEVHAVLIRGDQETEDIVRHFFVASSCGICGKASIESVRRRGLLPPARDFQFAPEILCRLPESLREEQAVFARTGGLHAAALFSQDGQLEVVREDIGRHNAVDKVIGWAVRRGQIPLDKHVLVVSGRGGFEIVQKALAAGIPMVASVSAPSSLAVKLARELGQTLVGFLRGRRFVVYSGDFRLAPSGEASAVASARKP